MPEFVVDLSWIEYHGESVKVEADTMEAAALKLHQLVESGQYALGSQETETYRDTGDFRVG